MENINQIIGKNLLFLRKQKKLTQIELAEQFNYSDKSISKWESCESLPSIEVLYNLANFYGVTLNDLVNENLSKEPTENLVESEKKPKAFPTKLVITLLAMSVVWLISTTLYVTFFMVLHISVYMVFIWSIPVSIIVLLIFNCIWGKYKYLFPILTVLLWTLLVSIHCETLQFGFNIWPIYIIGVPLQVAIILWGCLTKAPHLYNKKIRLEKKLAKKEEKTRLKQEINDMKNSIKKQSNQEKEKDNN